MPPNPTPREPLAEQLRARAFRLRHQSNGPHELIFSTITLLDKAADALDAAEQRALRAEAALEAARIAWQEWHDDMPLGVCETPLVRAMRQLGKTLGSSDAR